MTTIELAGASAVLAASALGLVAIVASPNLRRNPTRLVLVYSVIVLVAAITASASLVLNYGAVKLLMVFALWLAVLSLWNAAWRRRSVAQPAVRLRKGAERSGRLVTYGVLTGLLAGAILATVSAAIDGGLSSTWLIWAVISMGAFIAGLLFFEYWLVPRLVDWIASRGP
jgi:hypothetical protein